LFTTERLHFGVVRLYYGGYYPPVAVSSLSGLRHIAAQSLPGSRGFLYAPAKCLHRRLVAPACAVLSVSLLRLPAFVWYALLAARGPSFSSPAPVERGFVGCFFDVDLNGPLSVWWYPPGAADSGPFSLRGRFACTAAAGNYDGLNGQEAHTPRRWTPEEIALLGVESDRSIAKATKRDISTVRMKRVSLGIPPIRSRGIGPLRWGPSDLAFFRFGYSDKDIAKFLGRPIKEVKAKRAELAKAAVAPPLRG
jgi:hypothetical protein